MNPHATHFQIIPDFDAQSAKQVCYISHLPKMPIRETPQIQDHERDPFILRGPEIDFEGFMDIRPAVIIETAREVFEMVSKEEYEAIVAERSALDDEVARLEKQNDELNDRLKAMILQNAEQIVQAEALSTELDSVYSEMYDDEGVEA